MQFFAKVLIIDVCIDVVGIKYLIYISNNYLFRKIWKCTSIYNLLQLGIYFSPIFRICRFL